MRTPLLALLWLAFAASGCRRDLDDDGFTVADGDCDDADASANPDADEEPYNGVDDDCDADTLDDDLDGDGFDQEGGGDCDDAVATTFPGADEIPSDGIDQDCSGSDFVDADGDGFESDAAGGTDCDDADDSVFPGAYEECDNATDNDCDGDDDGCDLFGFYFGDSADVISHGSGSGYEAGTALAILDFDGDGYADIAAGVPGAQLSPGVETGYLLVLGGHPVRQAVGSFSPSFGGESAGDRAGEAIANAGDVNNDGKADLLVGAPGDDDGGSNAGAAYLELGPPVNEALSDADAKFVGESSLSAAGHSVAGAGDVNHDGFDDILVGAPYESTASTNAGAAYMVLGPVTGVVDLADADARFAGMANSDLAGWDVAGAGDVNNDGFDDVLVAVGGASNHDGAAVFLVNGPFSGNVDLS